MADRFDKFTHRARRALRTAQEESTRLGHAEIGAEHLLVGVARERSGIAWLALIRMGVDAEELASAALALAGTTQASAPGGGLSASARQTVELAVDEARQLRHGYVGTEHLLLGLLRTDSAGTRLLNERGITQLGARAAIIAILNQSPSLVPTDAPRSRLVDRLDLGARFADDALDVCAFAEDEARRLNHNYLGTEHLLLGLTRESGGGAGRALLAHGVDLSRVRLSVESIIGRGDSPVGSTVGFTPRATRALDLASEEAAQDGLPRAGSEHVLRGLIREGEGVAAGVLQALGVDVPGLMTQLHGSPLPRPPRGAATLETSRMGHRARSALEQGLLVARWYYQAHVDTEHLLIGLAREHECVAARVLADLGIDAARLLQRFEQAPMSAEPNRVGYTAAARAALDRGAIEARQRGHATVGTGHLLLGVVLVEGSHARALLEQLGVAVDELSARVEPYLAANPEG